MLPLMTPFNSMYMLLLKHALSCTSPVDLVISEACMLSTAGYTMCCVTAWASSSSTAVG